MTFCDVLNFLRKGKFVVTLGGEHAITLGPIKAYADYEQQTFSVLHFDAHADSMPEYEGSIYSHNSIIARVKELHQVDNVVSIGIRSMSVDEKPYLDHQNVFYAHQLPLNTDWMTKALNRLSENVYITFDVDVFDSSLMPSTGTPEPGGMFWNEVMQFVRFVSRERRIIGFDIVELCPLNNLVAPDFLTAKLIYKWLSYIFERL